MTTIIDDAYGCKSLYSLLLSPVCKEYNLNVTSIMLLSYLADNTDRPTASDIVNSLHLTKSLVSMSLKDLNERGYITCIQCDDDHRQQRLTLNPAAEMIVAKARNAQQKFMDILTAGFSKEEIDNISIYISRMRQNVAGYSERKIKTDEQSDI